MAVGIGGPPLSDQLAAYSHGELPRAFTLGLLNGQHRETTEIVADHLVRHARKRHGWATAHADASCGHAPMWYLNHGALGTTQSALRE
jgi:hypothetical protein